MVDGRDGVMPLDEEIARWLRTSDKPIILVINKAEGRKAEETLMEAFALGFGEAVLISAEHGQGIARALFHSDHSERPTRSAAGLVGGATNQKNRSN